MIRQQRLLLEWDPYQVPILTEHAGRVVFKNIDKGKTAREERTSGSAEWVIIEHRGEDQPQIEIQNDAGEVLVSYQMPTGAYLSVPVKELDENETVLEPAKDQGGTRSCLGTAGRAKKGQSRDIVTGLPRVTELFEARRPKDTAVISKIEGQVELESASRGRAHPACGGRRRSGKSSHSTR